MTRKNNGSGMAQSKALKEDGKGKKKLKYDDVFEKEELKDSDGEAGYDDSVSEESRESGSDADYGDYDENDEGEGSQEEPEQDKVSYQDLLIKLLREKVEKGKRKRGHIEKKIGKRGKVKVEKTKGEEAKERGIVVKTQSRSTQKIFYLDHLSRVPMRWGVRPRLEAWSEEKVNEAIADGKKESGDFGKLPSLNIAYGEEHPLTPRDFPKQRVEDVQKSTQEVVDMEYITQQVLDRITPKLMSVIDAKLSNVMKAMHQLMSQRIDVANAKRLNRLMEKDIVVSGEKHAHQDQLKLGGEGLTEHPSIDTKVVPVDGVD